MTENWSIRLARLEDADALPAIELAAAALFAAIDGLDAIVDMPATSSDQQRAMIRKGHSLVAEADGRLVGFVSTAPVGRELHIHEMSVHPDLQRCGIASILLRALGIDARNTGFAALTLTTFRDVPWNAPFYLRQGFVEVEDFAAHPRLAQALAEDSAHGLPRERRCAMIRYIT